MIRRGASVRFNLILEVTLNKAHMLQSASGLGLEWVELVPNVEHKTLELNGEDYGLGGRQASPGSASYLLNLYK